MMAQAKNPYSLFTQERRDKEMGGEKLKNVLKHYLKDPEDLDRITIVEKDGEHWIVWEETKKKDF